MKRKLLCLLPLLISSQSKAAFSGYHNVKAVKAETNIVVVNLDGFTNTATDIPCTNSNQFVFNHDSKGAEVRTAFLLSAYLTGKKVSLSYYGCEGDNIRLGSVQLEPQ